MSIIISILLIIALISAGLTITYMSYITFKNDLKRHNRTLSDLSDEWRITRHHLEVQRRRAMIRRVK